MQNSCHLEVILASVFPELRSQERVSSKQKKKCEETTMDEAVLEHTVCYR